MRLTSLALVLTLAGCSDAVGIGPNSIVVVNQVPFTIAAFAMEKNLAAAADIAVTISGQAVRDHAIASQQKRTLDNVSGYEPGKDVIVFAYRVNGSLDDPNVTASLYDSVPATADELKQSGGEVRIVHLPA